MPDLHIPAGAGSHQQAYLATPPVGEGPWPGVVVLQDAFGMTDDLREHTDRLATAGYVAVAPRLYTPRGGGPRCVAAVFRSMTSGTGPVFDDIDAARGWLAGREDCTGRVGVIGFCQGGGFALLAGGTPRLRRRRAELRARPDERRARPRGHLPGGRELRCPRRGAQGPPRAAGVGAGRARRREGREDLPDRRALASSSGSRPRPWSAAWAPGTTTTPPRTPGGASSGSSRPT